MAEWLANCDREMHATPKKGKTPKRSAKHRKVHFSCFFASVSQNTMSSESHVSPLMKENVMGTLHSLYVITCENLATKGSCTLSLSVPWHSLTLQTISKHVDSDYKPEPYCVVGFSDAAGTFTSQTVESTELARHSFHRISSRTFRLFNLLFFSSNAVLKSSRRFGDLSLLAFDMVLCLIFCYRSRKKQQVLSFSGLTAIWRAHTWIPASLSRLNCGIEIWLEQIISSQKFSSLLLIWRAAHPRPSQRTFRFKVATRRKTNSMARSRCLTIGKVVSLRWMQRDRANLRQLTIVHRLHELASVSVPLSCSQLYQRSTWTFQHKSHSHVGCWIRGRP